MCLSTIKVWADISLIPKPACRRCAKRVGWATSESANKGGTAGDPRVLPGVLREGNWAGSAVCHQRPLQDQPHLQLPARPQGRPGPRAPWAKAKVHWELTGLAGAPPTSPTNARPRPCTVSGPERGKWRRRTVKYPAGADMQGSSLGHEKEGR